ncbi:MAG: hypothetical protein ACXWC6_08885 [Ramlibacter sp.]
MPSSRSLATALVLAAAALGSAGAAHAGDVSWSVGVNAAPGVAVNVGNVRPVYVQPAPVYVQPAPVYVQPVPQTVYTVPPVVYTQPQVVYPAGAVAYYGSPVVVAPAYRYGHWDHHHHRHWN